MFLAHLGTNFSLYGTDITGGHSERNIGPQQKKMG